MLSLFDSNKRKYNKLPEHLRKRWSYRDFLDYRMQEMQPEDIEEFMTADELWAAEGNLNSDGFRDIFNDKRRFYERFPGYIRRKHMVLESGCEILLEAMFAECGRLIFKPAGMYAGIGVFAASSMQELQKSFEEMVRECYVAEEFLNPVEEYATVYAHSLNTVRITTFMSDDGEPEILFAINQFGSGGSVVDNDDVFGIWAVIDTDTGVVTAAEVNPENGFVNDVHPDTLVPIVGFVNTHFEEMKKLVLLAAKEVPQCRLLGWDVTLRADGMPEIIEGNVSPEMELYQKISRKGLRKVLDKYISMS